MKQAPAAYSYESGEVNRGGVRVILSRDNDISKTDCGDTAKRDEGVLACVLSRGNKGRCMKDLYPGNPGSAHDYT